MVPARGPFQAQSVEQARARQQALAKMRSLLFHQEAKLKHLAKIKSKDYHRRAQRAARAKVGSRCPWMQHVVTYPVSIENHWCWYNVYCEAVLARSDATASTESIWPMRIRHSRVGTTALRVSMRNAMGIDTRAKHALRGNVTSTVQSVGSVPLGQECREDPAFRSFWVFGSQSCETR